MHFTRIPRPSPSMAVAIVALVLAAAGGGWAIAASRSTTIRACVNKRSGAVRLATRCRRGERRVSWNSLGPRGPRGLTGAKGPRGATGPIGPSNVFEADRDGLTPAAADGANVTVATLSNLPAGTYDISAKTDLTRLAGGAPGVGGCTLTAGGDADGANEVLQNGLLLGETIPTHVTHTFTATGSASLSCTANGGTSTWTAAHTKLIALKVGALTRNAVTG